LNCQHHFETLSVICDARCTAARFTDIRQEQFVLHAGSCSIRIFAILIQWQSGSEITSQQLKERRRPMKHWNDKFLSVILSAALVFAMAASTGIAVYAENPSKTVESGATWLVNQKSELSGALVIKDGATVKAPDGYLLVMTVDGVETAVQPGTYVGKIVLTPTQKITKALYDGNLGKGANTDYRTGLFVDTNKIVDQSSVTSALVGGTYDNHSASGININSNNVLFDGLMIHASDYSISNVRMNANGAGGNDFTGYGAGIAVTGKSNVDIDNFTFNGVGPIRHGIYVGGQFEKDHPVVVISNSFLRTNGSIGATVPGTNMSSVPWVLGIDASGHVRTQLLVGYGDVTYKKSTLLSDGWGVVSTDDTGTPSKFGDYSLVLKVKDSLVDITGTSGYGSYSIGACRNIFNHSILGNTQYSSTKYGLTYGLIVANEYASGEFINGTEVTSRYGVMYHKNQTGVTKVDSSTFHTHGAVFLIKHCYPVINVSNSKLISDTGVIVQLMSSDDPGLAAGFYRELLDPASVSKDQKHDIYHINKGDTTIFKTKLSDVASDAQANFSDMEIKGDFYNSVTGVDDDDLHLLGQNLVLNFDAVDLTGVISSAVATHRNYSLYFGKENDASGNKMVLNADGYQVDAKWETKPGIFGMKVKTVTPATDADGHYVTVGNTKYERAEGVILSNNATYLGDMVNHPAPAVNNGVLVTLKGGTVWTVSGTSYLTNLAIEHAHIIAPEGYKVVMTVDGKPTEIKNSTTYSGNIVFSLNKETR
jgi:hypothetical protein